MFSFVDNFYKRLEKDQTLNYIKLYNVQLEIIINNCDIINDNFK